MGKRTLADCMRWEEEWRTMGGLCIGERGVGRVADGGRGRGRGESGGRGIFSGFSLVRNRGAYSANKKGGCYESAD